MNTTKRATAYTASAIFLASAGLYLYCFQPAGGWGDGPDFVLCSYFLGVPHPTGYPLYALLGKIAASVPAGSIAFRVGLLSSFCGALAAAMFFLVAMRLTKNIVVSVYAAVVMALSTFLWSQSVSVEAYSLNLLLCAGIFLMYMRDDDPRVSLLFFFVAAMGMGNHGTLVFPAFILGLAQLVRAVRKMKAAAIIMVGFLVFLGLSVFICLPLFSARSALFDWNHPQLARNMWLLLTGYDFWVIGEYIPAEMWRNFLSLAASIGSQLSVVAAALFLYAAFKRKGAAPHRLMLLAVFFAAALFPILYPTREKESFFLISFTLFLLFAAAGLGHIFDSIKNASVKKIALVFLAANIVLHSFLLLKRNSADFAERTNVTGAAYSDAVFLSARRDALVLIDHVADDTIFPPMYDQFVNNRRRDVFILHRLYLAFPWYMDAMRARAAELDADVTIPQFNMEQERERVYEVSAEEKERREIGKTMNTISIDIQTVRLLESNMRGLPVYMNTPDRFRRSQLSAGFYFAPDGALFRLGPIEGAPAPESIAAAYDSKDKIFRAMAREIMLQRGLFHRSMADAYNTSGDITGYANNLTAVASDLESALKFEPDCNLNIILNEVYTRLGRTADAKRNEETANECMRKKLDLR